MEFLVKIHGIPEHILKQLIDKGYFKTKTEAVRAGIMKLGTEYHLLKKPEELEKELSTSKAEIGKKTHKGLSEETAHTKHLGVS